MPLVRMSVGNYRCFTKPQNVELRPITVVLGRNNAGKSALVRAPLIISTGIHTPSAVPLDLDRLGEEIVESFTDLIYGGRPHGNITIDLEFDDDVRISSTIQNLTEFRTQVISSFEISAPGYPRKTYTWIPDDPNTPLLYRVTSAPEAGSFDETMRFDGLLPMTDDPLIDKVRKGFDSIRYLGPFRERPARRDRQPIGRPTAIGNSGENALKILANDILRNNGRLIAAINDEFGGTLPGWELDVDVNVGTFTVVLRSTDDPTIRINIVDVGTGVAQALPIFVQRALDLVEAPDHPVLEVVEQPELHLHPAAHGALADLYVRAALETRTRFLIETHSETFLLRLRRRIAEGHFPARSLSIYFVENQDGVATARQITVTDDGNLDYWPDDVFSEDYHETIQIARAQEERSDTRAG